MKILKDLRDYITNSKIWIDYVGLECEGVRSPVFDYAPDVKTNTVYLFCKEDGKPLTVKELLAASYKYPNLKLSIWEEDWEYFGSVKGFLPHEGDPNFGEPNFLEMY